MVLALFVACGGSSAPVVGPAPSPSPPQPSAPESTPSVEKQPAAEPRAAEPPDPGALEGPPEGLRFEIDAEPFRSGVGWGLRITLVAQGLSHEPFDVSSQPAPNLWGERRYPDGTQTGFGDGCAPGVQPDTLLSRGKKRRFVRRFGDDEFDSVKPGETLTLRVGLCNVGLPDGRWLDVPAATVVIAAPESGKPTVDVQLR